MNNYLVIRSDWLEEQIRRAEKLRESAQSTGKPVAIAAASIRLESLKEIREKAIETSAPGKGRIDVSFTPPE